MISKNKEKKKIKLKEKAAVKHFKFIRPNLVKLFTHFILFYLVIKGYLDFRSSNSIYNDFLENLNTSLISDVKIINSSENCESPYEDIETTYFPVINNGCRCDFKYFKDETLCYYLRNLSISKEQNWTKNCDKLDNNQRELQKSNSEFNFFQYLPKGGCRCYEDVNGTSENKTIQTWYTNQRICVKKNVNLSTYDYLKSAMDWEECNSTDLCQNYFCKTKYPKNAEPTCPIVDVYFDHFYYSTENNMTVQVEDETKWYVHPTDFYNKSFTDNTTYQDTILAPILGLSITRTGRCNTGEDSIIIDYSLVDNIDCALDQRYYTISKLSLVDLLKRNNHYNDLSKVIGFNKSLERDINKWNLDLKYGFYRNTLTCLMKQYDQLNKNNYKQSLNKTLLGDYQYKKTKIGYILEAFITFTTSFLFQENIQKSLLALNSILVLINILAVFYKLFRYWFICFECCDLLLMAEKYITFLLELSIGILGGFSYFILSSYQNYMDNLVDSGCVDNYVQYQIGMFSSSLSSTADQNFEIFLIILIKMFFILLSTIYYSCAKGERLNCKEIKHIIKENIADGEDEDFAQLKSLNKSINTEENNEDIEKYSSQKNKKSNDILRGSNIDMVNIKEEEKKKEPEVSDQKVAIY
jgi:hypothetical protein